VGLQLRQVQHYSRMDTTTAITEQLEQALHYNSRGQFAKTDEILFQCMISCDRLHFDQPFSFTRQGEVIYVLMMLADTYMQLDKMDSAREALNRALILSREIYAHNDLRITTIHHMLYT
jgi:hypothetical protein